MTTPNIIISHRWQYGDDYLNLTKKFKEYNFKYSNYSVPEHDPLNLKKKKEIRDALEEQVRQ